MYALLDYAGHQLGADETVRYTNQTGVTLGELVMAVEPNLRGGFLLENVMLAGNPLTYDLSGHQLTVHLPQGLAPGAQITLAMRFRIDIPAKIKEAPYGYDVDQVNLTDWYPFIVPYSNGWILHDPSALGEYLVYDSADFEVNIKTTASNVVIAASGLADSQPNGEWTRYRLSGARTFAISASDQFQVYDATAGAAGARIYAYYYPGYETQGAAILNAAVRAVGIYNTSTQAVLTADLTSPDKLQYLIKRNLSTNAVASSLWIKSNLRQTQFKLLTAGLTPATDYWLVLNGGIAETYTADSKGRLFIDSPLAIPSEILDLRSVALWDTSSNVVVSTTLP